MAVQTIADKQVEVDAEGYLLHPEDWTPEMARVLAKAEGIELTDRHWEVINFARQYYKENGVSPTLRQISKGAGVPTKELFRLFPKGPGKKVARIAGIPKPAGCV